MTLPAETREPPTSTVTDPGDHDRIARLMVMAMYALLLASVVLPALPLIIGMALAYATRGEAPDVWRSHFDEGLRAAWLYIILVLVSWPLWFVLYLGVIPMAAAYIILVFRSVRGLLRASRWTSA